MKRWKQLSIRKKIVLLIIGVGLIPSAILFRFSNRQMKKISQQKQEYIMNQNFDMIFAAIEERMNRMEEIAAYLTADDSVESLFYQEFEKKTIEEKMRLYNQIEKISRKYMETSSLDEISFYLRENKAEKKSIGSRLFSLQLIVDQPWYQEFLNLNKKNGFAVLNEDMDSTSSLAFVRGIWNPENYQELEGVVVVEVFSEKLKKKMISIDPKQIIYLECGTSIPVANDLQKAQEFQKLGGEDKTGRMDQYYCIRREIGETGVYLVSALANKAIYLDVNQVLNYNIALFIVLICVVALLSFKAVQSLTSRITLLETKWEELQKTGTLTKLEIEETSDEIGHLIQTYNYLVDEIGLLMQEQRKIGEEKKNAMLKALQAQINPHFLYNTLEMISWMIVREDKKNAQRMIKQLSRYYKLALNKGEDIVSLQQEVAICQSYMEIQSNRFSGQIQFILNASEQLGEFKMPKLIIQPLLENAILHGIVPKKDGHGVIKLQVWKENESIMIELADDGVGFCYESREKTEGTEETAGSKYGLYNVRKRLEMYFERDDCMKIESTLGIGTRILLKFPMERGKQ